jgi:competence protein ComEC
LLARIRDLGIAIERIGVGSHAVGGSTVQTEVLWPPAELPPETTANDTSLVIRLTHAEHSILLTGDIERYAQDKLLSSGVDLSADVLLLPHHGSVNEATAGFVAAVAPSYVLRSSHHRSGPMASALSDLVAGYQSLDTPEHGAITVTLQRQGLTVESFHPPAAVAASAVARKAERSSE